MRSSLVPNAVDVRSAREPADRATDALTAIAEHALAAAIAAQSRPSLGMFVARSAAESEAIERAAREICTEAHRLNLPPEQLLIETKRAWGRLASVRTDHLGDRDGDVLREVVSACIEIYFGERDPRAE
jgi:hypothetical protein